jgi:hypothetical protein
MAVGLGLRSSPKKVRKCPTPTDRWRLLDHASADRPAWAYFNNDGAAIKDAAKLRKIVQPKSGVA